MVNFNDKYDETKELFKKMDFSIDDNFVLEINITGEGAGTFYIKYYNKNSDYLKKARKYGHFTGYEN